MRRRRRRRAPRNVPVLFASLGSTGHDAQLSAPQPRASCLHESRLIGQRAPPFKRASSPRHWLWTSCILNRRGRPLGAATKIIHSNRTTRPRLLRRQKRGLIFSLSHPSQPPPQTEAGISKDFGEVAPPFPAASASGVGRRGRARLRCPLLPLRRGLGDSGPGPWPASSRKPPGTDRRESTILHLYPVPPRLRGRSLAASHSSMPVDGSCLFAKTAGFRYLHLAAPPKRSPTALVRIVLG